MRFAVTAFCFLALAILSFWLLIIGKNFLIPLVIAFFAAFLIQVITSVLLSKDGRVRGSATAAENPAPGS